MSKPVIAPPCPEYGQRRNDDIRELLNIERKIEVYRNLHNNLWSVRQGGILKFHTTYITLENCTFVVQPAGHARVLQEHRKNVHAFVRGHWCMPEHQWKGRLPMSGDAVSYDPYFADYFYTVVDKRPIRVSKWVDMWIEESETSVLANG